MHTTALKAGFAGFALCLALGASAFAEERKFKADLTGGEEVPPVETSATGTADITYDSDSKMLSWTTEHSV